MIEPRLIEPVLKNMFGLIKTRIWFYHKPVDFRKQINGLSILLASEIGLNPGNGEIFVFRSKRVDKLKILYWDRNGFWLIYRKLEKGRFRFPQKGEDILEISSDQMQWLMSGLNIEQLRLSPKLETSYFH